MAQTPQAPPSPPIESPFQGIVQQDDLFEVLVEDDSGSNMQFCPAQVFACTDTGFQVYFLTRCHPNHPQTDARHQDQLLHVFANRWTSIPWQSVNAHVPLSQFSGSRQAQRKRAFRELGYRDLGGDRFYKMSEEQLTHTVPALQRRQLEIGDLDSDDSESDDDDDDDDAVEYESLDEDGNLKDLVVPDDQVALFTRVEDGVSAFADEMHRAQSQFDAWQPATPAEQRTKDWIDGMETRLRREEANRAWGRGAAL